MVKQTQPVFPDLQISVIGAGAMGSAIINGLLQQHVVMPEQILATDPREETRYKIFAQHHIGVSGDNTEAARWGNIIIFAVKPQVLPQVLAPLHGLLREDALCLSVAAGIPMHTFVQALYHPAVVRAIPNTPAQIGEGMTVWTATPEVSEQQREWAQSVLGALGREQFVAEEHYLDMATAISGSGPAYIFLLIEAMTDAGVHLGFSRSVAQDLVLQTILGAVCYTQESALHPAQLRNAVTSPGGTTAAGLSALEDGRFRAVISDAIWAAYRRSCELGRKDSEERG